MLNCGLDTRSLSLLVSLIENVVNPEALANVVKELQRETQALRVSEKYRLNLKLEEEAAGRRPLYR